MSATQLLPRCARRLASLALLSAIGASFSVHAEPTMQLPDGRIIAAHSGPRADPPGKLPKTKLLPNAAAALVKPYAGTPIDVTTYHYDNLRTGWNQSEATLTPANVATSNFGLLATLNVDGLVMAEPLLVSGYVLPGGQTHDILLVATEHDTLYAFDAQTYTILWQRSLGHSEDSGDVGCGDVVPEYGISSTPIILRSSASSATVYVVAGTEPTSDDFHTYLHAIDLGTGNDVQTPVEIAPTATLSDGSTLKFQSQHQWSRSGLAWGNNSLYVSIGSHCDNNSGSISGWMLRYGADLSSLAAFHTIEDTKSYELASIWMSGFAPAIDSSGNLFAVTGNGSFDLPSGGHNYGESVLELSSDLSKIVSWFTPVSFNSLNKFDTDFGSGGVMLLPSNPQTSTPLAVAMGKDSTMYLMNRNSLGGLKLKDSGTLQALKTTSGVWGGPAYYGGTTSTVFYQTNNDYLRAYSLTAPSSKPTLTQFATGTTQAGFGGSIPIVSSNGTTAHTGVVWLIRRASTLQLEAYDAEKLGAPIYAANAGTWTNTENNAFVTPLEANGRVYVGASGTVSVFGLAQ